MIKKQKKIEMRFISLIPGLEKVEDAKPQPAKKFLPDWWKTMPLESGNSYTAKVCPSMSDYFSMGYVLPMWTDSALLHDKTNNKIQARQSMDLAEAKWDFHPSTQLIDHAPVSVYSEEVTTVFKAVSPWRIITPPGYSTLQLPLFYHFNKDFTVLPGIIDTDIYHDVNLQILYHSKSNEETIIKLGTPMALYIPFKREKSSLSISQATKKDLEKFYDLFVDIKTRFIGDGWYRSLQRRKRDK